jgi:hypothetical protein
MAHNCHEVDELLSERLELNGLPVQSQKGNLNNTDLIISQIAHNCQQQFSQFLIVGC